MDNKTRIRPYVNIDLAIALKIISKKEKKAVGKLIEEILLKDERIKKTINSLYE
jgi:hypothetical protein